SIWPAVITPEPPLPVKAIDTDEAIRASRADLRARDGREGSEGSLASDDPEARVDSAVDSIGDLFMFWDF
uniref:hypothetical protein n=1 Tax=Shumkonia mesophila TaxID=2838854 RepID=UPI002934FDD2